MVKKKRKRLVWREGGHAYLPATFILFSLSGDKNLLLFTGNKMVKFGSLAPADNKNKKLKTTFF